MTFRPFDRDRDRKPAHRIWREIGWIESGQEEVEDLIVDAGRAWVADIDGVAECLVISAPGTVRHLADDLPMTCVTGVTTSRVARKQGFAGRLTAGVIAADVADGALVASLGMFEQGFYDRLGFGSGGYENLVSLDPKRLRLPDDMPNRVPKRLTTDDWEAVHACRLDRGLGHGACTLTAPTLTRADMLTSKNGFGLGFADGPDGRLTHLLWCSVKDDVEIGP